MTTEEIRFKLRHALTAYDRRQSKRKYYNRYALGQYFQRMDSVCADIDKGASPRQALIRGFNDRLLDVCLKAIGEPKFTKEETYNETVYYKPVND